MKKTVMSKKTQALRALVGFIEDMDVENAHFKVETDDSGKPKTIIISSDEFDGIDDSPDEDDDCDGNCDECEYNREEDEDDDECKHLYTDAIDTTILLYKNINTLIEERLRFETSLKILGTPKFVHLLNKIRESSKTHSVDVMLDSLFNDVMLDSLFNNVKDESNKEENVKPTSAKKSSSK